MAQNRRTAGEGFQRSTLSSDPLAWTSDRREVRARPAVVGVLTGVAIARVLGDGLLTCVGTSLAECALVAPGWTRKAVR